MKGDGRENRADLLHLAVSRRGIDFGSPGCRTDFFFCIITGKAFRTVRFIRFRISRRCRSWLDLVNGASRAYYYNYNGTTKGPGKESLEGGGAPSAVPCRRHPQDERWRSGDVYRRRIVGTGE